MRSITGSFAASARLVGCGLVSICLATSVASAPSYTFTLLTTDNGYGSLGADVNKSGQVSGVAVPTPDTYSSAVIWNGATPTKLAPASTLAQSGTGRGINESGQVVGYINANPTLWSGGVAFDLGSLPGMPYGDAYAINDQGTIVGGSYAVHGITRATMWTADGIFALDTPSGAYSSFAHNINTQGDVVGQVTVTNQGYSSPVLWSDGLLSYLPTLGRSGGMARDINDLGQMVGWSLSPDWDDARPTLWSGGSVTDLGTLGGLNGMAHGLNNTGQIVGNSSVAGYSNWHATLWNNGAIVDLNQFLDADLARDGWSLISGLDVTDNGWIAGQAYNGRTQAYAGYSLFLSDFGVTGVGQTSSVPEPSTVLLTLAGLGLIGFTSRRKRRNA